MYVVCCLVFCRKLVGLGGGEGGGGVGAALGAISLEGSYDCVGYKVLVIDHV